MKLRLRENSIRLRLTQCEVSQLAETGFLEAGVEFGSGANERFCYRLISDENTDIISANFLANCITVRIPAVSAINWATTEQVGIGGEQALSDGEQLSILIEKDFTCLAPRSSGDDDDTFPHPGNC